MKEGYEIHYIILRADKEETMQRAIERTKLSRDTNIELVEAMWKQFTNLDDYEPFVINTTNYSVEKTVAIIKEQIKERKHLLYNDLIQKYQ